MSRTAFITGITGQDGSYLAKLLVDKGYKVYGGVRRSSSSNTWRLAEVGVERDVELVDFELTETGNVLRAIERIGPDEIYNLGAQSFVGTSFDYPTYTVETNTLGPVRILEAIRQINPKIRFYQASTSEMFGKVQEQPQTERTPFYPRSPYGISKLHGHWFAVNYREGHGIHASSGILFNHESPLRGREFVTRKITSSFALMKHGKLDAFTLGNLEATRDWGFAGDYVEGMWLMLQAPAADDYVLATGQSHSVRQFIELAAPLFGFALEWRGTGDAETGIDRKSGRVLVRIDKKNFRPAEVGTLVGLPEKARRQLGWQSRVKLDELVAMMGEADDRRVRDGAILL
jgi:GDPmannose 4,6-dehydratase